MKFFIPSVIVISYQQNTLGANVLGFDLLRFGLNSFNSSDYLNKLITTRMKYYKES